MEATQKITDYIKKNEDWKGQLMHSVRNLILQSDPNILEEWKWNSPVWSCNGMVCSIGAFKKHVSLTFFRGAELENMTELFNSLSDSKNTRSIIWKEKDVLNQEALQKLIACALYLNSQHDL